MNLTFVTLFLFITLSHALLPATFKSVSTLEASNVCDTSFMMKKRIQIIRYVHKIAEGRLLVAAARARRFNSNFKINQE